MQEPINGITGNVTVTGVPVSIDAFDPNGNNVHVATVSSDASGTFSYTWAPTIPGDYKITATFAGSNSYGSSSAVTHANVVNAVSATTPPIQQATQDYTMTIIGSTIAIAIVVVIAVAIATVLILRKR